MQRDPDVDARIRRLNRRGALLVRAGTVLSVASTAGLAFPLPWWQYALVLMNVTIGWLLAFGMQLLHARALEFRP